MEISIPLTSSSKCLLNEGDVVDFNTPFLENKSLTTIKIPVAKKLAIKPAHIFRYLKKFVGEKINKGEILAIKKGFFGSSKIVSDYNGLIQEINHEKGVVSILVEEKETNLIKTFFKGEIWKINKKAIILKVKKGESFPIKYTNNNFGGETFYFSDESSFLSSSNLLNKIFFSESLSPYLQSKIEALGAAGFVLLSKLPQSSDLPFAQIKNIKDYKKILNLNFPYCLIIKENATIYFYQ